MRLYLEPSVLVKLFKSETDSSRMIEIVSRTDMNVGWSSFTSSWSLLEIARALKKDGKPKELIELDLRELHSHRIEFKPISREILALAERIVTQHNIYASDSVHAATYLTGATKLDAFVTDDNHFRRLKELVNPKQIKDISV